MPTLRSVVRPQKYFMEIKVQFQEDEVETSNVLVKSLLTSAVRSMFGTVGICQYPVDVLTWDNDTKIGIVVVPADHHVECHSAFALYSKYDNKTVHIHVQRSSPFLSSFAINDRQFFRTS